MKHVRLLAIFGLIVGGILSRFLPHPPNFTAINAIALFGGSTIGSLWWAAAALFSSMFLSDLVLGFHSTIAFVYLAFGINLLLGRCFNSTLLPMKAVMRNKLSFNSMKISRCLACSLAASTLFFIVVNLGAWLTMPCYPSTLEGLGLCYLAAVPFFLNQLLGDLFYSALIFSAYSIFVRFEESRLHYECF